MIKSTLVLLYQYIPLIPLCAKTVIPHLKLNIITIYIPLFYYKQQSRLLSTYNIIFF